MSLIDALIFAPFALVLFVYDWLYWRVCSEQQTPPAEEIARAIRQAKGDFSDGRSTTDRRS